MSDENNRMSYEKRQAGRRAVEKARKVEPYLERQAKRAADKAREDDPLVKREAEREIERKARKG